MKKLLMGAMLCGLASAAFAQEAVQVQEWTTTLDLSYTCKYIWRGFDRLDNAGAFQPSIDFLHESGFGANLWMSYPERGGSTSMIDSRVNATEYNYTLYYTGTALSDCWETNYRLGWRYFDFIDTASEDADLQEVFIEAEMPKLTGTPMTPHLAVYQLWPAQGGGAVSDTAGTIYLAGFSYGWTFDEMPELPMSFSWDIVFNDGAGGSEVDHDWSHMVWGLKTQMQMGTAKLVPAVYFQNSFDNSVNNEDELWGSLSYLLTF